MFQDANLQQHLETTSVIKTNSFVTMEWNLNIASNIAKIGNYRYRPSEPGSKFYSINNTYDPLDTGLFYTGATYSDITVDGGYNEENIPVSEVSTKQKEQMLFSLEDCFGKLRPRSGINKLRYFDGKFLHHSNPELFNRPRYYMAHKTDPFKYWTSYRTESQTLQPGQVGLPVIVERGISKPPINGRYYIDDAAPFIVYKEQVPANRIVVKMQTNVGDVNLGPFANESGTFEDPFYGDQNKTVPLVWKIQALKGNSWEDVISFNSDSVDVNGNPIINSDGYVELEYGLIIPDQYLAAFKYGGQLISEFSLPENPIDGTAYLIKQTDDELGVFKIWNATAQAYEQFNPSYGWQLGNQTVQMTTNFVTDLTSPKFYYDAANGKNKYVEFDYLNGLRIVVTTMKKQGATFDLIELSPRLVADVTDKVKQFSITKSASNLGASGLPVGELLAGTGGIDIFDYDLAFSELNETSIVKDYIYSLTKFNFYEAISAPDGYDYFVPIKSLYSDGFPKIDSSTRSVSIELRDLFFYFESQNSPEIFIPDVFLGYAIALLLDYIGFSNYVFLRVDGETDPIIPFFFCTKDTTVADVLQDLAVSTQSAMFFDEYNNFVVMSKNYMLPTEDQRATDIELLGTQDFEKDGVVINAPTNTKLANIIEIASEEKKVFNAGKISYTSRYIERSYNGISQSLVADRDKTWVYKPVLLWQPSGTEITKSINGESGNQSSYTLSAIPLNSDLSDAVPTVVNNKIINNVMDLGEGIYWISRYNGYFYANGEIIKYDAVEFTATGQIFNDEDGQPVSTVWIKSNEEYQNYFAKLSFNGKLYPTGRVRIYSEPNYEVIDGQTRLSNGSVAKHGRGQFNTNIVYHYAGINPYWKDPANKKVVELDLKYLFGKKSQRIGRGSNGFTTSITGRRQISNGSSFYTTGIIKNFLSKTNVTEIEANNLYTPETGTIQASALIIQGSEVDSRGREVDDSRKARMTNIVHKQLSSSFAHVGTRLRIVGSANASDPNSQTPYGSDTYYTVSTSDPTKSTTIGGSSGGIVKFFNPSTGAGYYFEIAALTDTSVTTYSEEDEVFNLLFYKVVQKSDGGQKQPMLLWGGLTKIVVDPGVFTGQNRKVGEPTPTVYDIAIEHKVINNKIRFYLYVNDKNVAVVDDDAPSTMFNNVGLFSRGTSRVMFENIYAIGNNYAENTSLSLDTPVQNIFGDNVITANEALRKYALSGMVRSTYLSGISPSDPPAHNMYFEEFGTIMREAAYFNVKYDKAYPALYAQLSQSVNRIKGYTSSNFYASAYGAEFLIFNNTDTVLSLDSKDGNALSINGVTFTQQSVNELSVDDYFNKISDFSNPEFIDDRNVRSPLIAKEKYNDIKNSRLTFGRTEFTIDAPYIQTYDLAFDMMDWMINKIMVPRKSIGLNVFGMPLIQLGDIVTINYKDSQGNDQVTSSSTRYAVYHIEYSYDLTGPRTFIYVSEVS